MLCVHARISVYPHLELFALSVALCVSISALVSLAAGASFAEEGSGADLKGSFPCGSDLSLVTSI